MLKRKRLYESQLNTIIAAHDRLEQQVMVIEGAAATMEVMAVMKQGAAAMKQIHNNLTVDQVDNVMEDVRQQMDVAAELNTAIAQPSGSDTVDDDDLVGELAALEQQVFDEQLLVSPQPTDTLANPTDTPTEPISAPVVRSEAEELAQLEAAMAI